ncbi:MAG: sulfotransferase [Deltaproteobacteria bacterium]|nr:sulfotransferase [Deltaproteobacteria bacterium]MBW2360722.1 sulfotransferase [Deltaproteobacteria bacterium]
MLFYFDVGNYLTMIRLAWGEKTPLARYYYLAVLCLAVPVVSTFHAICFALDWVLFPGLRKVEVKEPVFMVGHARSGTTLTHRLLSQDEGRFSSFLLYECYFPSLLQKKVIRAGIEFDRVVLRGLLGKLAQVFEKWRYGKFRHMHAMGLTVPEEDDIALYYSMASGFWITKMPYMGDLDFYNMNDWPEAKRRRYNDMYRELVRRQLYLNGPDKIHLAKNPLWAGRVESLVEAFPDAKFIINIRDPRENIPSLLKLLRSSWKQLGWDEARQQRSLAVMVEQSWHSIRHPIETLDAHPETRGAIVDYRELTSDPGGTIERIYRDLGLPMTDGFREQIGKESKRKHATSHTYSLEEFGLEGEVIRENLGDLFERFKWDSEDPPPEAAA